MEDIKQTLIEVIIALKASEKDINTTIPLLVCQFEYLIFMVKTSSLPDATWLLQTLQNKLSSKLTEGKLAVIRTASCFLISHKLSVQTFLFKEFGFFKSSQASYGVLLMRGISFFSFCLHVRSVASMHRKNLFSQTHRVQSWVKL